MHHRNDKHLYEIDVLRIFAALAVLIFHMAAMGDRAQYFPEIVGVAKYGFLGVPLFFLISGFVIMKTAENQPAIGFAISRFTRLYPTFWLCSAVTSIFLLLAVDRGTISLMQYVANATLLNDYFGIKDIDPVYWTLHFELQFYGCVLFLMLTGMLKYRKLWITLWLLNVVSYYLLAQPFFLPWLISPHYSTYFIGGVAMFMLSRERHSVFYWGVLASSLVLALLHVPYQLEMHTDVKAAVDYRVACLLILGGYALMIMVALQYCTFRPSRVLILCGAISYPIYLLHHRIGKEIFYAYLDVLNPYALLCFIVFGMIGLSYFIHLIGDKIVAHKLRRGLTALLMHRPNQTPEKAP